MITVANLHSGMGFGELALIKNQPRAASIQCSTNCHLAVLDKQDYMKIIGRAEVRLLDLTIEFLYEIPFFKKWSKKKLGKLSYYLEKKKYLRKQAVFTYGSNAKHVYIVKSGEFELTKPLLLPENSQRDKNFNIKVALLGKGEIFCEAEVMKNLSNSFTCTCYSTVGEIYCITADNFKLKFSKKSDRNEETKRNIKYTIRETRLKNFKTFLTSNRLGNSSEELKPSISTIRNVKHNYRADSEPSKTKIPPLTKIVLSKLKSKALGNQKSTRAYININTPFKTLATEEVCTESSPRHPTDEGLTEMCSHTPGGYYRARLKKKKRHSKNISELHWV